MVYIANSVSRHWMKSHWTPARTIKKRGHQSKTYVFAKGFELGPALLWVDIAAGSQSAAVG